MGWEKFTDYVIKYINEKYKNVVFMLWGSYAAIKGSSIDDKKHLVLKAWHPSPYSSKYFFGCGHFKLCNEYLVDHDISPIDWDLPS